MSWACETDAETMLLSEDAPPSSLFPEDLEAAEALCRSVSCPVLVVTSELDACQPPDRGARVAELTGARLVELKGAGHLPNARHPVLVNLLIKEFVDGIHPPAPATPPVTVGSAREHGSCSSPRRSDWGTHAATSPSPTPCASSGRTSRSTG